jgi:hypothetical protein
MNQLVTNKTKSKTIMRQNLRKWKSRLVMRATFLALCALIFVVPTMAQTNVYMHTGSSTLVGNDVVKFYDSGGESSGPEYYWERWFLRNEDYTYTFKAATGYRVKVTFKQFTAYTDNNSQSPAHVFTTHPMWSLRLNTAELSIYDGMTTDAENLITTYTGSVIDEFTVMSNGSMTFHFKSYGYREEGWYAEVQQVPDENYAIQKPAISFQVCDDQIVINPNNKDVEVYYTTDGTDPTVPSKDPLSAGTLYEGPFSVSVGTEVRAIAYDETLGLVSGVASLTYTTADVTPTPGKPTITRTGNTITMTPAPLIGDINETYEVWYTTEEGGAYTRYTGPIEWNTPNTTFYAITKPMSCSDKISAEETLLFDKVQVPDPTVTFTVTNQDTGVGTVQIDCPEGYVLSYTTDGSDPATTGGTTNSVTLTNVAPGTTVKAIAYKVTNGALDTNYKPSNIVTLLCLPDGEGESGVYGGVVILDDREDHSWSYYSDGDQPVHSLEPRDIKITYYGNSPAGRTTMTNANESGDTPTSFSATATGVKVGIASTENQDQFIYLKTLEKDETSGNYPYTAIPNPFQVRPVSSTGTMGLVQVTGSTLEVGHTYVISKGNYAMSNTVYVTSNNHMITSVSFNSSNAPTDDILWTIESGNANNGYIFKNVGNNKYIGYTSDEYLTVVESNGTPHKYDGTDLSNSVDSEGYYYVALADATYNYAYFTTSTASGQNIVLYEYTNIPGNDYHGFYAWRVKSMSDGLAIQRANGNNVAVDGIINADEEIKFVTSKEEGNEVEFEALWAKAYVTTSNSVSGLNGNVGYERNFMVLNNATGTSVSGLSVPCTVSAYYPDGTNGSTTSYISGAITCSADLKIENIRISGDNSTMTANTHDLIIGRGVTAYNTRCASMVRGLSQGTSDNLNYTIRIESGKFQDLSCLKGTWDGDYDAITCSGSTVHVNAILGCDYDRAESDNSKLRIDSEIEFGNSVILSNINSASNTLFFNVKSGNLGQTDLEIADYTLYMGIARHYQQNGARVGRRFMLIEGGQMSNIAGGVDENNPADALSFQLRMKDGNVRGAIYGSGAFSAASGDRRMVITGGKVGGWIAAGCNGTSTTQSGGVLPSDTYIYIGGDVEVGNKDGSTPVHINTSDGGNVFGAGSGNTTFETTGQVNNANVVIADDAYIQNNVFGGGNYGYTSQNANVYVIGGTIGGSVFGGSNQKLGNVTNITMRDGTVTNNIYGGSNITGTVGGLATVSVYGGTVTNVFGGGCGAATIMNSGTVVNINGGTISNNVYGGGEEGKVNGNTNVTVSGGTMKDVYGAGKGNKSTSQTADVSGQTYVTVTGGSVANVFGGGEAGNIVAGGGGSGSGNTETYSETFNNTTAATWNAGTSYIPDGWNRYVQNSSYAYVPRVSNYSSYNYLQNNDGNYLLFSARTNRNGNTVGYSYAIMPKYDDIETVSFKYRFRNASYGQLQVGYVTSNTDYNTFTALQTVTRLAQWTTVNLTEAQINTINSNNGYIAFRFYGTNNTDNPMYSAAIDDVVVTVSVPAPPTPPTENEIASYVTIGGGNVSGDVFGGGKLGTTDGNVQVNVEGGNIRGNVFGGAYGDPNQVFVAGVHTVNIMGGRVFGSVYGGSRNANDALSFTGYDQNETKTSSVLNISAGQIDEQVYTAGYYGKTFGSVYTFIGTNAILNAPHCAPSFGDNNENKYKAGNLRLGHNVWAGGDWGEFQSGSFGAPTVSGYSDIYVDGDGYNTETTNESAPTFMNIAGSIFGCGTSCDAGKKGRAIVVSNYGQANGSGSKNNNFPEPYSDATRSLYSIQRADTLVLNNAHINFTGHAKVYTTDATEKYAINSFDKTVRIVGGSSLFMNAPTSQIKDWWNASCDDVYLGVNATYTPVAYNEVAATPNKIRVNGGNYIEVYHDKQINSTTGGYGMLNGFAYMMVSDNTSENTCAYARPKWCEDTPIDSGLSNDDDGGWVSYDADKNTVDIDGYTVSAGSSDQMPYENHINSTKAGEQYFRIWRAGGYYSEREAVVNILADGTNTFDYVEVSVKLPAWRSQGSYYKFQTTGQGANLNTTIDYGADVMMYNSALIGTNVADSTSWVRFDEHDKIQEQGTYVSALNEIRDNPNVNFGLVALPGVAMAGDGLLVCNESDAFLAKVTGTAGNYQTVNQFTCDDFEKNPEVTFRFTYSNLISTNMTWDPMYITLVQVDENGEKDIVKIAITINIATTIDRVFTTQTYAVMNGTGSPNDEYVAKVVLPTFDIYDPLAEHLSQFKLQTVTFDPETGNDAVQTSWIVRGGETINGNWQSYDINHFAMEISAANNEDNSDGWNGTSTGFKDSKTNANASANGGLLLGETGGRDPFAFDFRLTYKGDITFEGDKPRLGMLTFTITYDNVKVPTLDANGNPTYDANGNQIFHAESKTLIIKVDVIRRGKGTVFYLDGQHGSNANNARYPDKAALSLSTIFNRCGYLPGDIIYIVNEVDVDDDLEWSGTRYNGVIIYRYPGGHPLSETHQHDAAGNPLYWIDENHTEQTTTPTEYPVMITGEITGNPENEAYTGALINVQDKGNLVIRDITLDGHMTDHVSPFSTTENPKTDEGVEAESPMIVVSDGGTLTMTNGTTLQENNSSANGGGVAVNDGGTLMMNEDASIINNVTNGNGGGVYMAGTMIVSDAVKVNQNTSGTTPNNVFLNTGTDDQPVYGKVIQIGTTEEDDFGPLTADAIIGVTKRLNGDGGDGFTQVVYVESENDIPWLDVPFNDTPNGIIYHDGQKYQLVQYDDPQYLYWIGTWVTLQDHIPTEAEGGWVYQETINDDIADVEVFDIYTEYQLAWIISLVNGENHQSGNDFSGKTVKIHADIDMDESIWVPIGTNNIHFKGTFEGNGHVITGIHSILANTNTGMFGVTENATIQDVVAQVTFDGNSINKGTFIGTMIGGKLANVEAAGTLVGKSNTVNMGGLVGLATSKNATATPIIHSGFSVNTIYAENASTVVGGLVGSLGDVETIENEGQTVTNKYYANLYNSYANATLGTSNVATKVGSLVGINHEGCTVENCYVVNPINNAAVFAYTNDGTVNYCYAANGTSTSALFVDGTNTTNTPVGYGTYDIVKDRKALGYMYGDNAVTAQTNDTTYIRSKIIYGDARIKEWTGLLSSLNQWVTKMNGANSTLPNLKPFTVWFRPTSGDINGDLPVLGFGKDNSFATEDGKFLWYATFNLEHTSQAPEEDTFDNGLDMLLTKYTGKDADIFLYGAATEVSKTPSTNVNVFINEDAVLIQEENAEEFHNVTVGITFDNSSKKAHDFWGDPLNYDWHLMSTPLADAALGITYGNTTTDYNYWAHPTTDKGQAVSVSGSYMPDMEREGMDADWEHGWDFYTYYEPQYHWINFKRNINSHHHYDEPHDSIPYIGMEQTEDAEQGNLIPGRGYMMAIDLDSYLNNSGALNRGVVTMPLTVSGDPENDPAPTKDWGSNLVGNPYQAYLNLAEVATQNGFAGYSQANGFYIYDADNGTYGPYITNASVNPAIPSQYIHPHQAFFVVTNEPMTLTFDDQTMATTTSNPTSYFRGEEQPRYPVVNLFAENRAGNRDMAVIELNRPELGGLRKVENLRNANFKISAHLGGQNYGLIFTPEGTEKVPVHFDASEDGVYTLTWSMYNGDFTSLRLVDNKTGVNYDMLANNSYTFEASADDYASRFYITYNVIGVDENVNEVGNSFAFFNGSEWVINGKGHLDVIDVTGRVLYAAQLNSDQNRVNLDGVAKGVYLLRVIDNKVVRTQKIIVR